MKPGRPNALPTIKMVRSIQKNFGCSSSHSSRDELKKYGKTVMAWTDMNNYYPDIMKKLPKDVIPVFGSTSPILLRLTGTSIPY
jgi:hypothetical protein